MASTPDATETPASPPPTSANIRDLHNLLADAGSIEQVCALAASAPLADTFLGIIWKRAFEEGRRVGYEKEASAWLEQGLEKGQKKGQKVGQALEEEKWRRLGHSQACFTKETRELRNIGTQVNVPTPRSCDAIIQTAQVECTDTTLQTDTCSPARSTTAKTIETPVAPAPLPFNWADDASTLPTRPNTPRRDLSILHSPTIKPFSSLQRRSRRSQAHKPHPFTQFPLHPRPQHHHQHTRHIPYHSPIPPHQHLRTEKPLFAGLRNRPFSISLDWESDPRLSDLAFALKALGWVRH